LAVWAFFPVLTALPFVTLGASLLFARWFRAPAGTTFAVTMAGIALLSLMLWIVLAE